MRLKILASFCLLLISCNTPKPDAPIVRRCLIYLQTGREICMDYKIDVVGGHNDPETESRLPITDKSICFAPKEWQKLMNWRDEIIMWAEDTAKQCQKK